MRRQPRQPPKVLMLLSRKHPAGWPVVVRPEIPPKPDRLRNRHVASVDKEECEYLEPIQNHVYEVSQYKTMCMKN